MLTLSRTKYQNARVPPKTLPLVIIHGGILLLGIITLQHVMQKQLPVGLMVLSDGMVHFLKIEKNLNKSTKTMCKYLHIVRNKIDKCAALPPSRHCLK